MLKGFQAH